MCENCAHVGVCKYTFEAPSGEIKPMLRNCDDYIPGALDIPTFLKEANRLGYIVSKKKHKDGKNNKKN